MRTIACAFALLFALASPAVAQMHGHGGGGHGGGGFHSGGFHGGGMGGFHGGHGFGGAGFHGGHHGGFWRGGVWYMCSPWMYEAGMCGADY